MDIGPPEIIIVLILVLVMFGGAQLPKLARNLGKAQQEFKSALKLGQDDADESTASTTAAVDESQPSHESQH